MNPTNGQTIIQVQEADKVRIYIQSVQKETQTFKGHFWGVKNIDCKNDSMSVALPFNKELYSEVLS